MSDEHLTKVDGRDVWFISARGKGFTCWADFALKSPQGYPVAAPAEGLIAARHVLKHKAALWEHILDETEKMYDLQEKREEAKKSFYYKKDISLEEFLISEERHQKQTARCAALIRAMAILNHGVADETSIALTEAEAIKRYKLSSE